MSSFKKAAKSQQKAHKERSQVSGRQHLGFLEKRKDYRLRAQDHERKQNAIRLLRKKALNKNPDEFYFHMCNSRLEDDEHREKAKADETTVEQVKLMQTQDSRYINYKRVVEMKKIESLKSSLHFLDAENKPKNKHVFYVDNKKEVRKFNVPRHLDTVPAMLGRNYNRPRKTDLKDLKLKGKCDEASIQDLARAREKSYSLLSQRLEREKQLFTLSSKMEIKRQLADKKGQAPIRMHGGTKELAPVYKWRRERKR